MKMGVVSLGIQIRNSSSREATMVIYDEIGWDVNASDIVNQLTDLDVDVINVRINSPGGDAFDGIAIMNALRGSAAKVVSVVEGLAASAASVIAVGGSDELIMRPNAEMMIHDALAGTYGNSEELRSMIDRLESMSDTIAGIYADKAGGDVGVWRDAMRAETWFTAQEAVDAGLADRVEDARDSKTPVSTHFKLLNKFAGRRGKPAAVLLKRSEDSMDAKQLKQLLENLNTAFESINTRLEALEVGRNPEEQEPEELTPEKVDSDDVAEPASEDADMEESLGSTAEKVKEAEVELAQLREVEDEESAPGVQTVTLDIDTYNELKRAAEAGWQASEEAREKQLAEEVDNWVKDGRISASTRGRALKLIHENPELARETFGANPVNTIPRREAGHAHEVPDNGGKQDRSESFKQADMAGLFPSVKF